MGLDAWRADATDNEQLAYKGALARQVELTIHGALARQVELLAINGALARQAVGTDGALAR